jgi:hypothetical protein
VAAALRLLGITWGLPGPTHLFSYQPDEYFSLQAAFGLLNGDPNPHFFNYPSLYLYLAAAPCLFHFNLGGVRPEFVEVLRAFTLDARLMTVLLALVTVGAAYGAATRLAGRRAGLLAAAIVAVAPGHVLYSHFAAVDVPLACFMTLAAWASVVLLGDQRWKIVILAGLACGASAATKYNGALVLAAPLLALAVWLWRAPKPRPWRAALLRAAAVVLIAAVAFAILSPYVFLDWQKASHDIAFEMRHMREGEYPAKAADPCGWWFQTGALCISLGGWPPLILLLLLAAVSARRTWPRSLPLLLLTVLWFAVIGATGVRYARYGLPLVPLLAIGAAVAVPVLQAGAPWRRWVSPGLAGLAAAWALLWSLLLIPPMAFESDPRDAALAHLQSVVPAEAEIGILRTVWFDMPPLDFNNGGDALGRLYAQFHRPVRPLVVIPNFSARGLRIARPQWLVETDFQLADWLRVANPAVTDLERTITELYVCDDTFERGVSAWHDFGPLTMPHDFSYPFTTIRVWRLKPSEDTLPVPTNPAP